MKPELTAAQAEYQRQEFARIRREMFFEDILDIAKWLSSSKYWFAAIGSLGLLTSCAPPPAEATPPPAEVFETEDVIGFQEEIPATEEVIKTPEVVASPTPEATFTPPLVPTPTPTGNPLSSLPTEWQDRVDHIETLTDGRTVAIATSEDTAKPSLLRVLELNSQGEWVSYTPSVISPLIDPRLIERMYPQGEPEMVDISGVELQSFSNSPDNEKIPLGYIGRAYLDPEKEVWLEFVSGVIIGYGQHKEIPGLMSIRLQVPTAAGDFALVDIFIDDQFQMGSNVFTLESFSADFDGDTIEQSGLQWTTSRDWEIRGSQLFQYFKNNPDKLLNKQLIFGVMGGRSDKPGYPFLFAGYSPSMGTRQEFIAFIKGGKEPTGVGVSDSSERFDMECRPIEGLILPQEIIDEIDAY